MLQVNARPEVGKVIVLKLSSGEEIITKLIEDRKQTIIVSKPISVGMDQSGRVAMMPFMVSLPDKTSVTINMTSVILFHEAREEMSKAYIQNTSNIIQASENDLSNINASEQPGNTGGMMAGGFKLDN